MPSVEGLRALCEVLGLEFRIGPVPKGRQSEHSEPKFRRGTLATARLADLESHTRGLVRLTADAGGDPIPPDLRPVLLGPDDGGRPDHIDEPAVIDLAARRPVDVVELAAAAGDGEEALDERVKGCLWFRRDWLDQHGIDPARCAVIGVRGESMEPLLPDGCSILVDRLRRRRRSGRVYVLCTGDGVVVKRLQREPGGWLLVSEHPAWAPAAWTDGTEIVGEVRWIARMLG